MQNIFFNDKNHETFIPLYLEMYLLPKDWLITATILAIDTDHNIARMAVLQANQENISSHLDEQKGHPSEHIS